jgi:hypothetical protein
MTYLKLNKKICEKTIIKRNFFIQDKWSFPIDDLVEIYRRTNRTVNGNQIIGCARRAFAAAQANKVSINNYCEKL